jgi:hypothetical protein
MAEATGSRQAGGIPPPSRYRLASANGHAKKRLFAHKCSFDFMAHRISRCHRESGYDTNWPVRSGTKEEERT